jgi:hypothetical protein
MSSADRQRWQLIAVLVVGVVVSPFSRELGLAVFLVVGMLFLRWRRTARAKVVFDREAKTDETGPRPDQ